MPSWRMIFFDELRVDDEPLFDLEGGPDPQDAVGAPGAGMDVGDGVGEQQAADLAVGRRWNLMS